jgi:hypothetical protein
MRGARTFAAYGELYLFRIGPNAAIGFPVEELLKVP